MLTLKDKAGHFLDAVTSTYHCMSEHSDEAILDARLADMEAYHSILVVCIDRYRDALLVKTSAYRKSITEEAE